MEDRLLFILFYLKTYPLQTVLAYSFEISQSEANFLVHQLSFVLRLTLKKDDFIPPRVSDEMLSRLEQEGKQDYGVDGTERRIIRPGGQDVQQFFYSGKSHCHTLKNNIVAGLDDRQVKGLSATYEGKKHDKEICDEEGTRLPEGCDLYQDKGFQGFEIKGVNIHQPKKKPRGGELTSEEKEANRLISSIRVIVEHVIAGIKRCRIVKDVFRNTKADYDDEVIELACGLYKFRSCHRRTAY
ncbi:MAG: transposase family protein [Candidatus Methylumidiphilus sp.]